MSLIKELLRKCEQIQKGIKNLQKEEKNMIKTLSYISKINQNQRKIDNLMNSPMKNMNITFNKDKCIIEYKEYYFNEKKLDYFDKDENELNIDNELKNENKIAFNENEDIIDYIENENENKIDFYENNDKIAYKEYNNNNKIDY